VQNGPTALGVVGKGCLTLGAIVPAFVGYQLWGTSLSEHSAQARLRSELNAQLRSQPTATHPSTTATSNGDASEGDTLGSTGDQAVVGSPATGSPVGFLSIPRIGMTNDVIVEGTGDDQLREGPGHYPGTPLPGQPGNTAIAGHRTTYAAPFYNLNEMQLGDPIIIKTVQGTFHYTVTQNMVVAPSDSAVLDSSTSQSELTLTTCNPRYSATQRLIIVAALQRSQTTGVARVGPTTPSKTAPKTPTPAVRTALADNGDDGNIAAAVLWGLFSAGILLGLEVLWRRLPRPRRWGVLTLGLPLVLVVLFVFFGQVSAVLPASF
jgi:sortase A